MQAKVGILLDKAIWKKIKAPGYERIPFYNRAAKKLGLSPFYLTVGQMSFRKRMAKGYVWSKGKPTLKTGTIPTVIHNRTISKSAEEARLLKKLAGKAYVFNRQNRYRKVAVHRLLVTNPKLRSHLPATLTFSPANVKRMALRFSQLYIKPQSGSVGEGILKLTKLKGGGYKLQLSNKKLTIPTLAAALRKIKSIVGQRSYLVQQGIALSTYQGRPYDIRVSVQKGSIGHWKITGMVGKVARKGKHVTNVAQGGAVYTCDTLFRSSGFDPEHTAGRVAELSLAIARHLGQKLPHLADVGLDIGVDQHGKPYFIEMNGRDQRYSFKEGNMHETWYQTYENPLGYAKYLLGRRRAGSKAAKS